ncbi:DUF523 domain-containing protein [uncultured Pseudodesulfovibrio sp.]|uniref:DUF523 domain-containing protein n=1 Tax=uncultured Pseudodesulfovibrio sp. TaxID=2035858 RepID=UPI0029C6E721|nr:DUF523 domain-containing protein [uncultured Pseudodesulfovibrio sp.]
MQNQIVIVSACLAGIRCRYDGNNNTSEAVLDLVRKGDAIPFCPEVFGGLTTPRPCCELQNGRVIDTDGVDRTDAFLRGAEEGLKLARLAGCTEAVLKANSPSCGCGRVYDGTFSGNRIPGNGVFAELLLANGFTIRTEEDLD